MKFLNTILLLLAAVGGYNMFMEHQSAVALQALFAGADANGYVDLPSPDDQDADTVYVVAATNCPHEAAQLADRLAKRLSDQGMPVQRIDHVSFRPRQVSREEMQRLSVVMKAPLPLVFIHGRVASNPAHGQVVQEYYRRWMKPARS